MRLEEDGDVAVDGGGGDAIGVKVGRMDLQTIHFDTLEKTKLKEEERERKRGGEERLEDVQSRFGEWVFVFRGVGDGNLRRGCR